MNYSKAEFTKEITSPVVAYLKSSNKLTLLLRYITVTFYKSLSVKETDCACMSVFENVFKCCMKKLHMLQRKSDSNNHNI